MQAQIALVAAIGALACLGFTQAIRCYACVHATGRLPDSMRHIPTDPKCTDPSSLKSLEADDSASSEWDWHIFLDPRALQTTPDKSNSMSISDVLSLFGFSGQGEAIGKQEGSKVYCLTVIGKIKKDGVGVVTVRAFFASPAPTENGCTESDDADSQACYCDTPECNNHKSADHDSARVSAASGLEMPFGLIAALALTGKLISSCRGFKFEMQ